MSVKTLEMSDGTVFYSFNDAEKKLSDIKKKSRVLLLNEIILIVLAIHQNKPVYGRTMIMKQLFLLFKEIFEKFEVTCQNPKFVPYDFGPYSFELMQMIDNLAFSKQIQISGRKNSRSESFSITDQGIERVKDLLENLDPILLKEIRSQRIGWDQLGTDGILRYVYDYYPEWKENSKIKNKYKDIIWGQGNA